MTKLSDGVLTPAYGRDYKTEEAGVADLRAGKDFTWNHFTGATTYCSIRDAEVGEVLSLRFDKLRQKIFYTVT